MPNKLPDTDTQIKPVILIYKSEGQAGSAEFSVRD